MPFRTNITARRIEWGECDPAGIVFYPRFFAMFDNASRRPSGVWIDNPGMAIDVLFRCSIASLSPHAARSMRNV